MHIPQMPKELNAVMTLAGAAILAGIALMYASSADANQIGAMVALIGTVVFSCLFAWTLNSRAERSAARDIIAVRWEQGNHIRSRAREEDILADWIENGDRWMGDVIMELHSRHFAMAARRLEHVPKKIDLPMLHSSPGSWPDRWRDRTLQLDEFLAVLSEVLRTDLASR